MADIAINPVSRRVQFTGNTGTGPFAFTFNILADEDIAVYKNTTLLTLTTDYTVATNADGTGSVTLVAALIASDVLTIIGGRELERTTDFVTAGDLLAASLNEQLDSLVIMAQQLDEKLTRSVKVNPGDVFTDLELPGKDARKGTVLGFNATSGDPEAGPEIADVQSLAAITADIATLADIEDGTDATDAIQTAASISSDISTVSGISSDVSTVAGVQNNVGLVANSISNVNTVATNIDKVDTIATNISDIVTVASDLNEGVSEINTVASDLQEVVSEINTVAASISNVDAVGTNIANVNTVAGISSNVTTVAGISSDTTTVAGISGNVTTVAGISSDVTAVAADATDIGTVATNISNVNAVAGNATNINSVASNATNINAVAADASDIGTVAGISANVSTVAGLSSSVSTLALISSDITTVAGISANVTTVAGDTANIATIATDLNGSDNIGTVAGSISNVNSVGGSISNVNTVATNLSSINDFADKYRIGATDPTTSLDEGDLFYNTTSNTLKVYTGSAWEQGVTAGSGFLPLTGGGLTGNLTFGDNNKATFGAGSDLSIFSNGTDSFIQEYTTGGHLYIDGTNVRIRNRNDNTLRLQTSDSGAVDLYYSGSSKLATTSTGIDVTGTVTADGLTVNGGYLTVDNGYGITTVGGLKYIADSDNNAPSTGLIHQFLTDSSSLALGIQKNGNVGIGTSSPDSLLELEASAGARLRLTDTGTQSYTIGNTGTSFNIYNESQASEAMRIDSSGNLGIGTTNPIADLSIVDSSTSSGIEIQPEVTTDTNRITNFDRVESAYKKFRLDASEQQFYISGSEAMRIDSSGNLLVGKTSADGVTTAGHQFNSTGYTAHVRNNGVVSQFNRQTSDGDIVQFYKDGTAVGSIGVTGGDLMIGQGSVGIRFLDSAPALYPTIITTGATASDSIDIGTTAARFKDAHFSGTVNAANFNTTSDATLKTNVETLTGSLDAVKAMRGVSFDWIESGNSEVGVIAQEVEAVVPDVVSTNDQGIKSVKYGNLVGVLIEAIKEQQQRIEALEAKLGE